MRKGEATKSAIVDKAVMLVGRDGINGMSIGNLASEMGLSKSGLFAHFGSKEALQVAIMEAVVQAFIASVIIPALRAPGGLPRITMMIELWFEWIDRQAEKCGCPLRAITGELASRDGPLTTYVAERQREFDRTVAKLAGGAIKRGHFREDLDVDQFVFEMRSAIDGYHFAHHLLRYDDAAKRARIAINRIIADAMAPVAVRADILAAADHTRH